MAEAWHEHWKAGVSILGSAFLGLTVWLVTNLVTGVERRLATLEEARGQMARTEHRLTVLEATVTEHGKALDALVTAQGTPASPPAVRWWPSQSSSYGR